MGLKLRPRDIPHFTFRRDLPEYLADGSACYIEIDARAGGPLNPGYVTGMDAVGSRGKVMDRKLKAEGDPEKYVDLERRERDAIGREMMGVLYDACVIEWRSNIVDGDAPITCDRERFLALADVVAVPEIASALREFAEEAIRVGKAIAEDDEQTEKN